MNEVKREHLPSPESPADFSPPSPESVSATSPISSPSPISDSPANSDTSPLTSPDRRSYLKRVASNKFIATTPVGASPNTSPPISRTPTPSQSSQSSPYRSPQRKQELNSNRNWIMTKIAILRGEVKLNPKVLDPIRACARDYLTNENRKQREQDEKDRETLQTLDRQVTLLNEERRRSQGNPSRLEEINTQSKNFEKERQRLTANIKGNREKYYKYAVEQSKDPGACGFLDQVFDALAKPDIATVVINNPKKSAELVAQDAIAAGAKPLPQPKAKKSIFPQQIQAENNTNDPSLQSMPSLPGVTPPPALRRATSLLSIPTKIGTHSLLTSTNQPTSPAPALPSSFTSTLLTTPNENNSGKERKLEETEGALNSRDQVNLLPSTQPIEQHIITDQPQLTITPPGRLERFALGLKIAFTTSKLGAFLATVGILLIAAGVALFAIPGGQLFGASLITIGSKITAATSTIGLATGIGTIVVGTLLICSAGIANMPAALEPSTNIPQNDPKSILHAAFQQSTQSSDQQNAKKLTSPKSLGATQETQNKEQQSVKTHNHNRINKKS